MKSPTPSPLRLAAGGLFSIAAAMGIGRFVYTPILPVMVGALPFTTAQGGYVAAANFLGYLLGALAASLLPLPGTKRTVFLTALFFSALTSALMAMGTTFWWFTVLRFLSGVASSVVLVVTSGLILERLHAAGRDNLSALFFAGVGCGIAFSAAMASVLIGLGVSWAGLWLASGAVTLLAMAAAAWLIPPDKQHPAPKALTGTPREEQDIPDPVGKLIRLVIAYALFGFGYVITMTFLSVMAHQDPALSTLSEFLWLVVGLSAIPSVWFWNRIALFLGGARTMALACFAEAVGVILSISGLGMPAMTLSAILMGGTFMGISAIGLMQAQRLTRGDKTRILAIMTASFGAGQVMGPWVAGLLYEGHGDFTNASLAAAAALLVATILSLTIRRKA